MTKHQWRMFSWAFLDDGMWTRMCAGYPRTYALVVADLKARGLA